MKQVLLCAAALAAAVVVCADASAQVLFSDNFDTNTAANWTVNNGPGTNPVTFAFDYSTVGIPAAPNSVGGTTSGVKLEANIPGTSVFGGVSISPTGQSFTGNYTLTADVWMSFNGPAPAGGSGSTQAGGLGLLTAGTSAQWAGGAQDSVHFGVTTDGNSSVDYRAYAPAAATGYTDASGVFAAGTTGSPRNHNNPYYAGFGGETAPAAQVALFPQQTGTTLVGSQGWAWHEWQVSKVGNLVTWSIDGLPIATVDVTGQAVGGNNILLNYYDTNTSSSSDPNARNLLFGLFDNVQVVVPEPASLALLSLGALGLVRRRR